MNILIISQYFWPENFKITDLALSLSDNGHNVTILTGIPNYPSGKFFKGYNFIHPKIESYKNLMIFRTILIPRGNGSGLRLLLNYLSFAFFASFAAAFRLKDEYDLIFVFEVSPITVGIPAVVLKKLKNIPIFFWVLDLWPESISASSNIKSDKLEKMVSILVKYIYRNCDKILVSSRAFIKSVIEKGVCSAKISYVPNWVEDVYFKLNKKDLAKIQNLFPVQGFKIMFAGNIGEAQDFDSIIKAAGLLKNYTDINWYILGDGRKSDWVKQKIKECGLENSFFMLGRYPMENMADFYSLADVMLVSLKDDPIFALTVPAKIQTYLACGKPVLAMLNGEGANIINEANAGFTCGAGDYTKLAENILKLYSADKSFLQLLSINASEYYEKNFQRSEIINKIENEFKELLEK